MKNIYLFILLSNFIFSDYLDIKYASFSYTIGGSYGSCVKFIKSEYNSSDFDACSCAWAANVSSYEDCYELYYDPQTEIIKYNLSEGGEYIYRNFSNDYTCHIFYEENQIIDCSEMNASECNSDQFCEWIVDIELGSCSDLGSSSCDDNPNCWGAYTNPGWYYGWYCAGGNYQINNSYCQEIPNLQCSELNENQCNNHEYGEHCNWIENIEYANCWNLNENQCNSNQGCEWDCSWIWDSTLWQDVWSCGCEGQYEIDNSYCEDLEFILGDVNQDYIINVMDIILVVNLILENQVAHIADLNNDFLVNVIDVIMILDIILEG